MMKAQPSPLKCICYFVTDLIVTANPKYEPEKPSRLDFHDLQVDGRTEKTKEIEKEQPLWRVS